MNMQNNNGVFLRPNRDRLSLGFAPVGAVTILDRGSVAAVKQLAVLPHAQAKINSVLDPLSTNGCNLYSTDLLAVAINEQRANIGSLSVAEAMLRSMLALSSVSLSTGSKHSTYSPQLPPPSRAPGITSSSAKAELNLLADILGVGSSSKATSKGEDEGVDEKGSGTFRINLFPEEKNNPTSGGDGDGMIFIDIDTAADAKTVQAYLMELRLDEEAGAKGSDDEDDLLALMDSVK